jgi:hypothetical protein
MRGDLNIPWRLFGGYSYCDDEVRAISHTHMVFFSLASLVNRFSFFSIDLFFYIQVGSGLADEGNIGVIPLFSLRASKCVCHYPETSSRVLRFCNFKQPFSHLDEEASPGYYGVTLLDPNGPIRVQLTSSLRSAAHFYDFSSSPSLPPSLLFDMCHSNSEGVGNCPSAEIHLDLSSGPTATSIVSGYCTFAEFRFYFLHSTYALLMTQGGCSIWGI